MASLEPNRPLATLAHLPGIYEATATDTFGLDGPLLAFIRVYEIITGGIDDEINSIAACFDPAITPSHEGPCLPWGDPRSKPTKPDFLAWLGTWVGVDVNEVEGPPAYLDARRRQLVKVAAVLWRHRGTPHALKAMLEAVYDVEVEIVEWAWPQGMRIEHSSTIGIDTAFVPELDLNHSFAVVWIPPKEFATAVTGAQLRVPLRRKDGKISRPLRAMSLTESAPVSAPAFLSKVQRIRKMIDRERPAHTNCYLALGWEEIAAVAAEPMGIGVHSTIGEGLLS
jgi:hypothetical protein